MFTTQHDRPFRLVLYWKRVFQHLTEKHEYNDHRCRLKVDGNLAHVLHRRRKQTGHQHRHGAEEERRSHTNRDQREHVQIARYDAAPAAVQ